MNDDAGAGGDAGGDRNCSALSSTSVHRTSPDRSAVAQTPPPAPVKRIAQHNYTQTPPPAPAKRTAQQYISNICTSSLCVNFPTHNANTCSTPFTRIF